MTSPRTAPAEPVGVSLARVALQQAQQQLHDQLRRGEPDRIVEATRYRVRRAHDLLEQRWHDAAVDSI